jgi:hypothetical protein
MIGDQEDMIQRQRRLLPRGWFSDDSPVLDAVLSGFSTCAAHAYELLGYVGRQARLGTTTDGFLDLAAYDFFGLRIRRRPGQSDDSFRQTILDEIFRERVTRGGIEKAVEDLTGFDVRMFEPFNASDCGGLDTGYLGYDMRGRWGDVHMPRTILIATLNPKGAGIPNAPGYDDGLGGLDVPPEQWGDLSKVAGPVTHQDIYDAVNATRAAGVTAWVAIGLPPEAHLDEDFVLDVSELVGPGGSYS